MFITFPGILVHQKVHALPDARPTPPKHIEKFIKFGTAIGIASQLYTTRQAQSLERFDLTVAQFSILNHLARRGPQGESVTSIAAAVEVKQPAVSKVAQKFEGLGWVRFEGAQGDARAKLVVLTEKGRAHLIEAQRAILPDYMQMLEGWQDEELERFTAQLFRLVRWMDENRK
jgi:DNA-binding MarR family transcriptional regulator